MIIASLCKFIEEEKEGGKEERKERENLKKRKGRKKREEEKKKIRDETDLVSKIGGRDRASDFCDNFF